jgi:hypothetical protein
MANLIRHHRLPPPGSDGNRCGRGRGGGAPSAPLPFDAFLRAALATSRPADRSSSDLAERTGRADELARDGSLDSDFGVASASPGFWSRGSLVAPKAGVFDDNVSLPRRAMLAAPITLQDRHADRVRSSSAGIWSDQTSRLVAPANALSRRHPGSSAEPPSAFSTASWT